MTPEIQLRSALLGRVLPLNDAAPRPGHGPVALVVHLRVGGDVLAAHEASLGDAEQSRNLSSWHAEAANVLVRLAVNRKLQGRE